MKAIVVEAPGDTSVLQVKDVPKPEVKSGWSLIKVKGFGINRSEIFTRQGLSPSVRFPRILGIECVGVIEETTDDSRLPLGQTVVSIMGEMGRDFDGSYAEYVLLPNSQIYPIKTHLAWSTLATIPETYYTAYLALLSLQLKPTDQILVRGATSGVGVAFAQLLKAQFPASHLTGSSRSLKKAEQLRLAGFDEVILDLEGVLQTEDHFDKVLELIGPKTIKNSLKHTRDYGIVCSTGQLGGQWYLEDFDPIMELQGNRYLTTAYSGRVSQETLQELFDYIESYQVSVKPEAIYRLEEIAKAHARMESSHSFGKNIVLLEDDDV
ncbi:zinc-binding alcohol dehydrogenase family protein [Streptococcus merionis]|uniref:Zinc-containing alcohol dehydrogenase n=1 Tax=Streptococcus merionis TaxID=400065 RepID=A0A239SQW8_9STRE|nr:zinc-binding alcohol dehydrogenase family protein [Streptococcus merionis]SNU87134.1 zinc-containing alcohol dehydrogenase [Streptococcus merionis]